MAYDVAFDALTSRVEACEKTDHNFADLTTLKDDITCLRQDVDELKSIDISMLWGGVDIPKDPSSEMPIIPDVSEIPLASVTGDATAFDKDGESDTPETDDEEIEACEDAVYEDLEDLEGDCLQVSMEALVHDTLIVGSSESKPTEGIVAQPSRVGDE
ncbi:uncharacterized protein LOC125833323 [Solanum verrucosum]|uniref:uncharacterized protein LOC125833323 n=1 Tax=Solanum verrucosum TaxID=315347 RepID=UPI0020D0B210|nr:uncharacterized protein LOC125833323 [Solanum verrucosum]